jgi:hypothetical protein
MVIGNYKLAEERIDKAIGELKGVALEANRLPLMADKALCEAQLGRLDASVNLIGEVVGADWSSVDADDQLIMASALHDAAEIAGSVLPSFLDGRVMELRAEVNEKLSRMKVDLAALLAWQLDGLQ